MTSSWNATEYYLAECSLWNALWKAGMFLWHELVECLGGGPWKGASMEDLSRSSQTKSMDQMSEALGQSAFGEIILIKT